MQSSKLIITCILALILCFTGGVNASAASVGPTNPGTIASGTVGMVETGGTTAWTSLSSAGASDDVRAIVSLPNSEDGSFSLDATNFGFSVPTGSTIEGIEVNIEGRVTNGTPGNPIIIGRPVKAGSLIGTFLDNQVSSALTATDSVKTLGGSTDLWNDTWTAADINDVGFGFAFECFDNTAFDIGDYEIDSVTMTVHFTAPLAVTPTTLLNSAGGGTTIPFLGFIILGVTASGGDSNYSYDWKLDGISLGAPDQDTYTGVALEPPDSGDYSCTVSDTSAFPDVTSTPLAIVVREPRSALNVPWFLDRAPADGLIPPSTREASFIAIHNNLSVDIECEIDYYDAGQNGVVDQQTPVPNTFLLPANSTYAFRPVRDDPITEVVGALVPNMPGGETAGTAIISWGGEPFEIQGRLVQIDETGGAFSFLLPQGNLQ